MNEQKIIYNWLLKQNSEYKQKLESAIKTDSDDSLIGILNVKLSFIIEKIREIEKQNASKK